MTLRRPARSAAPTARAAVGLALAGVLVIAGCATQQPNTTLDVPRQAGAGGTPAVTSSAGSSPPYDDGGGRRVPNVADSPTIARNVTSPDGGVSSSCPSGSSTVARTYSAAAFNATFGLLRLPQWAAADVGATTELSDGRVAWIFGDTLRPAGGGRSAAVNANSMLVSEGLCFSQATTADGGPLVALPRGDHACWPSAVTSTAVPGGDRVVVACSRVERAAGGLLQFTYLGTSFAVVDVPIGGTPRLTRVVQITPDDDDQRQVNWGAALLSDGRWTYILGSRQPVGSLGGKEVYLARAPKAEVTRPTGWQYWGSGQWNSSPAAATPMLGANPGVSQAFSVHRMEGHFVLVSKVGGEFGDDVGVWTAPRITGPWRVDSRTRYPFDDGSGTVAYQPLAHPEYRLDSGELLVSMSRNPKDFADLMRDPTRARPVFLEVPRPAGVDR